MSGTKIEHDRLAIRRRAAELAARLERVPASEISARLWLEAEIAKLGRYREQLLNPEGQREEVPTAERGYAGDAAR